MKTASEKENVTSALKLSKEEIDLIRKGLHYEEKAICEVMSDDVKKYQHQLMLIKNLYKKLNHFEA
jgi:hypothetical protein